MEVFFHSLVPRDLAEILAWYDRKSDTAGDRFFDDFEKTVSDLASGRRIGFPINASKRKLPFRQFPYSICYEASATTVFVFVVRHNSRRPDYGMRRRNTTESD